MPDSRSLPRGTDPRSWLIQVCTECGVRVEDDRDYGGPFPVDHTECPQNPVCGAFAPDVGMKTCPGERTVRVVEAGDTTP